MSPGATFLLIVAAMVLLAAKTMGQASQTISFPAPRSTSNYASLGSTMSQDLSSLTLCMHMRTDMDPSTDGPITPISYATLNNDDEFAFYQTSSTFDVYLADGSISTSVPVWDGNWHAVCFTWQNNDGAWEIYTDGVRTDSGSGLSVGSVVDQGGVWILAQEQDSPGGDFEAFQAYSGDLAQVNIWDRVLSAAEIIAGWSRVCHSGNVYDWATTNIEVYGDATRGSYMNCRYCPRGFNDRWSFGKCLYINQRPRTYQSALATCNNMGGKIFQLDNSADVTRLKDVMTVIKAQSGRKRGIWTGLTDEATEGDFVWHRGQTLGAYTDWNTGALDENSPERNCVQMKVKYGWKWVISSCATRNAFLCTPVTP